LGTHAAPSVRQNVSDAHAAASEVWLHSIACDASSAAQRAAMSSATAEQACQHLLQDTCMKGGELCRPGDTQAQSTQQPTCRIQHAPSQLPTTEGSASVRSYVNFFICAALRLLKYVDTHRSTAPLLTARGTCAQPRVAAQAAVRSGKGRRRQARARHGES
jgi:hypothetical protein